MPEYRAVFSDAKDARAELIVGTFLNLVAPCWLRNKAKALLHPTLPKVDLTGRHSQPPFGTAHP